MTAGYGSICSGPRLSQPDASKPTFWCMKPYEGLQAIGWQYVADLAGWDMLDGSWFGPSGALEYTDCCGVLILRDGPADGHRMLHHVVLNGFWASG